MSDTLPMFPAVVKDPDPVFYLSSGKRCSILEAPEADLSPEVLGAKLERLIRFQGQPRAMSVAEHQCLCAEIASEAWGWYSPLTTWCLVHDVSEAFTGDYHGLYKGAEARKFEDSLEVDLRVRGWELAHSPEVKEVDLFAREVEKYHIWGEIAVKPQAGWMTRREYRPGLWAELVRSLGGYKP